MSIKFRNIVYLIQHTLPKYYILTISYNNILNYKIVQLPKIQITNNVLMYLKLNNTKLNQYINKGVLNTFDFVFYESDYIDIDLQLLINIFNNITKKDIVCNYYIIYDKQYLTFFKQTENLYSKMYYCSILNEHTNYFNDLYKAQINNNLLYNV